MTSSPEVDSLTFGAFDYCIFVGLLAIHGLLGIYHALRRDRYKSAREFLSDNRSVNPMPVALSVLVTTMTSITYLGVPAETYIYGPTFWLMALNKPLVATIVARTFVPVFHRLQVNTIYEYLELRFGKVTSICGATLNFIFIVACTGIIVYAPALALTTVTGLELKYSIVFVGVSCSFYTTLGGVKAVMWTNLFQTMIMLTAFTSTLAMGAFMIGGFGPIGDVVRTYNIPMIDFSPNPTVRTSFWSCFIGGTFICLSAVASNQQMVQRFLSCKTERQAKNAVWLGFLCIAIVDVIAVGTGLVMYVYYQGCDPHSSGKVDSPAQLMPYFTVDLFSEVYGLSGLLVFSVFSASLIAVSSQLNSLANMTGYGVVKQIWPETTSLVYNIVLKLFVIIYGACTVGIAFIASHSQSLLQMTFSVIGLTTGPLLGVLSLGILCPHGNSKGAISGIVVSVMIGMWLQIGALVYPPLNYKLPQSTSTCNVIRANITQSGTGNQWFTYETYVATDMPYTSDEITDINTDAQFTEKVVTSYNELLTTTSDKESENDYPAFASIYSISYLYYGFLTWSLAFSVGVAVSRFYKVDREGTDRVDPLLVATITETYSCCLRDRKSTNSSKGLDKGDVNDKELLVSELRSSRSKRLEEMKDEQQLNETETEV